jgi:hypothetical protein
MEFRKVCVACTNSNGEPDVLFFRVGTYSLDEEHSEENDFFYHSDIEEIAGVEYDCDGPYVIWDDTDHLFDYLDCESKCCWDSAEIHIRESDFRAE